MKMEIGIYSHGFEIFNFPNSVWPAINRLCRFMGHYELTPRSDGRYENVFTGVYGAAFKDSSRFFFHISVLDKFISMVRDTAGNVEIVETVHPLFETPDVPIIRKDHRPPRNGQEHAIAYIQNEGSTKVICVEPGGGKTYILNQAMCGINKRLGMVIKAQYLPKWEKDIEEAHHIEEGDIVLIKGSVELIKLMRSAMAGDIPAKYILISNATYRAYIDLYESTSGADHFPYPLKPHELWGYLGVEVLAIDEGHQDFHFNHRLIVFSHVPKLVVLSGTLDPDNTFKDAVTKLTFPPEVRYTLKPIPPYLKITAFMYGFQSGTKAKWRNRGRPDYSQIALEGSIMANKKLLDAYTDMIVEVVASREKVYRAKGRVGVVFAATKVMCTHLQKFVKKRFPTLRVNRFIGGDPYDTIYNSDIIITTTKSCGTAKDIPGLAYSIMTEAVGDTQANLQHIKRLRKPPEGPDYFTPEFTYFLCENIQQHHRYHQKKKEIFSRLCLSHLIEYSNKYI